LPEIGNGDCRCFVHLGGPELCAATTLSQTYPESGAEASADTSANARSADFFAGP
jgi:hypothetical protein